MNRAVWQVEMIGSDLGKRNGLSPKYARQHLRALRATRTAFVESFASFL
jgi:hypothetical protein